MALEIKVIQNFSFIEMMITFFFFFLIKYCNCNIDNSISPHKI